MKKQITAEFAAKFKRSYNYKMGGKQTLQFPNGQTFDFDDRQYYSGRGSKYNSAIRHDNKGVIVISKQEVDEIIKLDRELNRIIKQREKEEQEKQKRISAAKAAGVYSLIKREYGTFIELSEDESTGQFFDADRLAKTLGISVSDASLLKSRGKTYVFAKTDTGKVIELYHSSLYCNDLCISVEDVSPERLAEFNQNRNDWVSAPFAEEVGQTGAPNHFVC